jgi:hypothetical protein
VRGVLCGDFEGLTDGGGLTGAVGPDVVAAEGVSPPLFLNRRK